MSSGADDRGQSYVGAMLRVVWQWVREQLYAGVMEAGYTDLNPAHVALFRYPSLDGYRPTRLAEELQITKQSVNDLLGHLEARGYLVRKPDPTDGRARVVALTAKGRRLERTINAEARKAELRIAAMLGERSFTQFRRTLETLVNELVPTGDVAAVD